MDIDWTLDSGSMRSERDRPPAERPAALRRRRSSRPARASAARRALALGGWALACAALAAASAPPPGTPVPPGRVRVKVVLAEADGSKRPAEDAVAWLPGAMVADPDAPAGSATIAQRQKAFEPRVQVVTAGTSVAFPNFDRIYHNVFSLSEIARFDLGLYRNGASRSVTFGKPGVIRIYCNIHPSMSALLVVVEGRAYAKTGPDGRAVLPAVEPGVLRLHVWHERGGERTIEVVVTPAAVTPVDVVLDASQWRAAPHKNKYGKDYPPPDDDETRY